MTKISLSNRKRLHELNITNRQLDGKKDELLSIKLQEVNSNAKQDGTLLHLPLDIIKPDPNQPRKQFKNIDSLAASIKAKGIIQPVIVRHKLDGDDFYYIIVGERRYRAAKQLGLLTIPCVVRTEADADILIIQLLENDQREKVSPFEEADALVNLIQKKNIKKGELANSLGRDSSWISMRLKLAEASPAIKTLSDDEIIDDVRTLYELKRFEDELPEVAQNFINKIRSSKIRGSFREAITCARDNWRKKQLPSNKVKRDASNVKDIYFENDVLMITLVDKNASIKLNLDINQLKKLQKEILIRIDN